MSFHSFLQQFRKFRACGSKQVYISKMDAESARKSVESRFKDPMMSYKCPHCPGFHLARAKGEKK